MRDEANIDAYFERIGFSGSIAPTLKTLETLHALHPAAIPFENLDPLMGAPIRLELKNLEQKLLFERRGGYCLEHNLLFKAMLSDLGFGVAALAARVLWGRAPDAEPPPSHIVLLVEVDGAEYLADVGFGSATLTAPLRLRADIEQRTPHESFRLMGGNQEGWRLDIQMGEEWRPVYAFDRAEQGEQDVIAINDRVQADGHFRDNLVAARSEKGRRLALHNATLKIHPVGGETETRTLGGVAEVKEALAGLFGIALPAAERLDPALERVLGRVAS
ncbi:MAG TPA: arylamine N-acetyltransferase [Alphaproteobacteria bacterium]|nr:arylamine N-acetyltransferase [Alphaproteobacteria bacterium]